MLLLPLMAGALYWRTLDFPFQYDDEDSIGRNPTLQVQDWSFETLETIFRWRERPLTNLSLALSLQLTGSEPSAFRIVNVVAHAANALLVFLLLLQLLAIARAHDPKPDDGLHDATLAWIAALLWLVHPLHPHAVTFIHQRAVGLSALCCLAALNLYLWARAASQRWKRNLAVACALALWLLGLLFKETGIYLPAIVLAVELLLFRQSPKALLKRYWGRLILCLGMVCLVSAYGVYQYSTEWIVDMYEHAGYGPWQRVLTELRVVAFYISLVVFPHPSRLNLEHHFLISDTLFAPPTTLYAGMCLSALFAASLAVWRKRPLLTFCGIWFFTGLLLESTVLPLEIANEYRLYLPSLGILFACLLLYRRAFAGRMKTWIWLPPLALALLLAFWCDARNDVWSSPITLWRDTHAKSPLRPRPRENLLVELRRELGRLLEKGSYGAAEPLFAELAELDPAHPQLVDWARVMLQQGRTEVAFVLITRILNVHPQIAEAWELRGRLLALRGEEPGAITAFQRSIELDENREGPVLALGALHQRRGELDLAIEVYSAFLGLSPRGPLVHVEMAIAEIQTGQINGGVGRLHWVIEEHPDCVGAHDALGIYFFQIAQFRQALKHFEAALRLQPDSPDFQNKVTVCRGRLPPG